ncbi:MAG: hypothetical protein ABSE62_04970 [Chthoniobacteraceae bacterium]|jgi:hypothetical protein
MKPISRIRSLGLGKVNRIVRAGARYQELKPAFDAWAAGEVYVCKKTGDYRFRFGAVSKSVVPWNAAAREIFRGPEELAFAAMVLIGAQLDPKNARAADDSKTRTIKTPAPVATSTRANIIALASASREAA